MQNIIHIHNLIMNRFDSEKQELSTLEKCICELQTKNNDRKIIDELQERYYEIKTERKKYYYLLESSDILEEFKIEIQKPIEVNFMGEANTIDNSYITSIYEKYIKLVYKIYPEFRFVEKVGSPKCRTCNGEDINGNICKQCGTEISVEHVSFTPTDTDRVNLTTKYQYERKIHFKECINQYQGKQNSSIKPKIYTNLVDQLTSHGLVREGNDIPKKIRFEKVTKAHISLFLKELGFSNHYEDLNLIYHNITGADLDDISYLERALLDDFDKLSNAYDEEYIKTKKITRKNFINNQYVLFQLLRRHKHKCSLSDFSVLKTIERKEFHDDICSTLFRKLGWTFQPIF